MSLTYTKQLLNHGDTFTPLVEYRLISIYAVRGERSISPEKKLSGSG